MGFWNSMAHAIRNTRAALAALGMLVVLGVLLYGRWSQPEVSSTELISVPVVQVERESDDAQWLRVLVETPQDGVIRLLWMTGRSAIQAGSEVQILITNHADGSRDYRLIERP
jgi:hypothetical protein